jgi:PAS domain S-box-containing protein
MDASVVATDQEFIIRYWNKRAGQLFGYRAEETIGKLTSEFLHFTYTNTSREEALDSLIREKKWKGRLQYKNRNGEWFLLDVSVTTVTNEEEEPIGYVACYLDVTEIERAKNSLTNFQASVALLADYYFIIDRNFHLVFIDDTTNSRLKEIYGFTYTIGENILDKLPADRKNQIEACFSKALSGIHSSYEINILTADNKQIWLQVCYLPVQEEHGYIPYACSVVRDITAKKEKENKKALLYKGRQLFEIFMENSPILALITDSKGIIHYLNPAYINAFHLPKEAIGSPVARFFPKDIAAAVRKNNFFVVETKEILCTTENALTADGKEHCYQVIKFPIITEDETYIGGWAVDISEEITLRQSVNDSLQQLQLSEKKLKAALAREHQLNDMKSRFVSMASHEFRTPLSTILSSVYLLEKYTAEEQQGNRLKHAGKIKEAVQHMNFLLDDFLSIEKLEEGKVFIHTTPVDLTGLIQEALAELGPLRKAGQVVVYHHQGFSTLNTDKKLVKNIVVNLLSNAFKFSGEKSEIRINTVASRTAFTLTVNDTGIGISKADQQHLFEMFFRGRNAVNIQGTGLGLHIAKRYVALLCGEISLQSETGVGTRVTVQVPAW